LLFLHFFAFLLHFEEFTSGNCTILFSNNKYFLIIYSGQEIVMELFFCIFVAIIESNKEWVVYNFSNLL